MDPQINTPWFADKSLYLTVLGFLLPFVSSKFGVNLSAEKITGYVIPAVVYIVANKTKTFSLAKAYLLTQATIELKKLEAKAVSAVSA